MIRMTPVIGDWYRRSNGRLFEIVAIDDQASTIELQFFDGTIDEIDMETWPKLDIHPAAAPEDWSGSVDMDPEDFSGNDDGTLPQGWHDPLEILESSEKDGG